MLMKGGREDDGGVLVDTDLHQALEIARLERQGVGHHGVRGVAERGRGQRLALRIDDLRSLLPLRPLTATAASVIHRLDFGHGERIAAHRYSRALPGGPRRSTDTAQPPATSTVQVAGRRRGSHRRVSALSHEPTQAHAEAASSTP
ncbi:hypothetical protein ADL04_02920 [Streptomyces sp. NRRL B-3648]|nr:hypothetical protein ADL04_02920 [Streptomyces sp. NRRL B-3648]